jgi:hypothetical protein
LNALSNLIIAYGHGSSNHSNVARVAFELVRVTTIVLLEHTKGERISYETIKLSSLKIRRRVMYPRQESESESTQLRQAMLPYLYL